jgi:murein DD-endopeptidase MepM/ murein hydrolase activator NlpD
MIEMKFLRPVDPEFPVTAEFMQINPTLWPNGHKGVDFGAQRKPNGTILKPIHNAPVYASMNGVIQKAGYDPTELLGLRIWVLCNTPEGQIRYACCHLESMYDWVKPGVEVKALQILGRAGGSGRSREGKPYPIHLHWMAETWPKRELIKPIFL